MPRKEAEVRRVEGVPVRTESNQMQLDYLTYLTLASLDIGLETGFKDGPMRDRGGKLSDTAIRIGNVREDSKTPIINQEDAMQEVTFEAESRASRRGKGQMEKKMRGLMRALMAGNAPSAKSRKNYFSFGKGRPTSEAIELAKQAKEILESAGFEVVHKPGTRGIHIVGFSKDAGNTVAGLQKYVRKKAMEEVAAIRKAQKSEEQREREALMAERKTVTDELMKMEGGGYKSRPDAEFDSMFSPDELSNLSPEDACERILRILYDPMIDEIRMDTLTYLMKRDDVAETLHTYPPFTLFTDKEFRQYVQFLRGEKRGAVAMRTPGRNYLMDLRARHRKGREPVQPWDPILDNALRLQEGRKAIFIRSSYSSAAETIAKIEQMYPDRAISWERSPESMLAGGGHWTITVEAKGKEAPTNLEWLRANFGVQMAQADASRDARFIRAVGEAINGRRASVDFTNESVPRWMRGMLDRKMSTPDSLVLKNEYWAKLQAKGIDVPKVLRGMPVYESERDREKGKVQYYRFKFTLSGEKFSKQLELARADARKGELKEATFEPGTEVARGSRRPLKERVAERIAAMKKEQEERLAARKGKKKKDEEA